jgi:VanZ family protein
MKFSGGMEETRWRGGLMAYVPLFLWIGVIFFLSSGQGSMSETSRIIRPILEFLFPTVSEETLQIYHGYVRKFAHFTEYAVLAFLAVRAFSHSSKYFLRRYRFVFAFGLVLVIASIDEFNQSFEASRTGSALDVLLDISGGITMLAALWIAKYGKPFIPRIQP